MKPIRFSSILAQSRVLRTALAPALAFTMTVAAQAGGSTAPTVPAEPTPASNWVSFTIGGAFVSGNDAGMRARTQTNGDFYGGIDSMQFSQALSKTTTLTIDGHAMPGLEDYEFNLDLTKTDLGYIKAGFKQYRTWYDGSGGFLANTQYAPNNQDPHLDRGAITFEAGLRMENLPEVTFKYTHAYRNGQKDSLAWGEGMPSDALNYAKLTPALWNLDEKTDTFELDIAHTIGNTDLELGLLYEHVDYTDSRTNARGNSTQTPYPNMSTLPPMSAYRTATATDQYTMDMFASHITSVTRFSDKLWLSGGVAYSTIDTDTNGSSRTFYYPYAVAADSQYANLVGGGQVSQLTGNLSLMWNPIADLTITPSVRFEHEETNAWASIPTYALATPANPAVWSQDRTTGKWTYGPAKATKATSSNPIYGSDHDLTSTITALDLRYTGISDWVIYGKCQFGYETEDTALYQGNYYDNWLHSAISTNEQEYVLGANWYALSGLSFSAQGVHSERDQGLDHVASKTASANAVPAASITTIQPLMVEHETELNDFNLRVTWRPLGNLSFVTRYDYSETDFRNHGSTWSPTGNGIATPLPASNILTEVENGSITSNILSESVTWNPMERLYLQGTVSWVSSETKTNAVNLVPNSDSDYVTASLAVGYAIDNKTDITASYTYYGAGNYNMGQGVGAYNAMSYGLNTQEHAINVTLTRMITENMIWNLKYGYISNNTSPSPDQSGGFNDFSAQMVSTGLQIRF